MDAIIIEDEVAAAKVLLKLIREEAPEVNVVAQLQSVEDSVAWFKANPMPDLLFMDIHLADGPSFAIFDRVNITCPVIFTTAYDEYALKAFELNGISYLLKPIGRNDLRNAMQKRQMLMASADRDQHSAVRELLASLGVTKQYKSCFLVSERDKLIPLATSNIAYIYIDSKNVRAHTFDQRSYYLGQTIVDIMQYLDPRHFIRANRQFIVARTAVKDISFWFGNKLLVNLIMDTPEKVIVSKAKVREFKQWFMGLS